MNTNGCKICIVNGSVELVIHKQSHGQLINYSHVQIEL